MGRTTKALLLEQTETPMTPTDIKYDGKRYVLKRDGYRDALFIPERADSVPGFVLGHVEGQETTLRVHWHQLEFENP
jgi:hypothetical protein